MTKQLGMYSNIVPILTDKHKDFAVKIDSLNFISELTSVPVVAAEILQASSEFPIVFSGPNADGDIVPLALMGLKGGENLLVSDSGEFEARYIPAFIRRYPYIYGSSGEDATQLTLCIDDESDAVISDGASGNRLFDDAGERTEYFSSIVDFMQEYQKRTSITKVFCKTLQDLELLEPMQADITFTDNEAENISLKGFYVVKAEKLKAITDEKALALFKNDGLSLLYAHMQSLSNMTTLIDKKGKKLKQAQDAANS